MGVGCMVRLAIVGVASIVGSTAALAGPVEQLPGRWSGWGKMTVAGGTVEKVKCVATYIPEGAGNLRHSLRCASASYRIDAAAKMKVSNGRVSGNWEERNYSTGGAISGKVTGKGLAVNIRGEAFKASMVVNTSKCRQSVNISPSGSEISSIAVQLAKC